MYHFPHRLPPLLPITKQGIAALYIKDGTQVDNFLHGGGQELGRRAGTENVLLAVGLGKAAEISATELEANQKKMAHLRDELQKLLVQGLPEGCVRINGPNEPTKRLPNTLSISIKGIVGGQLLSELSEELAASAGSACHTGGATVSGVLGAMGVPPEWAVGTLRLSVGRHSSMKDVRDGSALIIKHANERLAT